MSSATRLVVLVSLGLAGHAVCAQSVDDILNFVRYSDNFASAGQPTEAELASLEQAGFERIVNIAFSTDGNAVVGEDKIVRDLGMEYVQIPVVWTAPAVSDYESFVAVMRRDPASKTLLHCQVNMRASAFAFLYRVLEQGVPLAEAKAAMNTIWEPNDTWRELIFTVLANHGISPDCEGCIW